MKIAVKVELGKSGRSLMTWFYDNCYRCNPNGSFQNVDPECPVCSGIGKDWGEGEDQRQKLKSIFSREPRTGTPPDYNYFGRKVHSGLQPTSSYSGPKPKKSSDEQSGCLTAFFFVVYSTVCLHVQQVYLPQFEFWQLWLFLPVLSIVCLIVWTITTSSK